MQQVNLYQVDLQKTEADYSAAIIYIILGYMVFIGLVVSLVLYFISTQEIRSKQALQEQADFWNAQLDIAYRQHPEPKVDDILLRSIEGYESQISRNENVLEYLNSRKEVISNRKLSIYLEALTQVKQDNLWLTNVSIKKDGRSMSIKGQALEASALPEYIKKISDLDIFKSMEFVVFDLKRVRSTMKFVVSSEQQEKSIEDFLESAESQN
ncbi:MAG: hypothetical protein ACJA1U_000210 [Bermanella sp.]|jgi:hypothetical protein